MDNGDTLTYSLSGTNAGAFGLNTSSGQITTSAPLNHETQDSYSVTITVTDGSLTDTIDVTIDIIDVNEAPVFTEGPTANRSIAENTSSSTSIGSAVVATDVDDGDTLTYSLGGTDAGAFGFDTGTGQITTDVSLNHETKSSYSVTITVTDGNLTASIGVTIDIIDVNETPVFSDNKPTARSIAENTSSGVSIGSAVVATDVDDGDMLSYTLGGTNAGSFGIVSNSGQLQTRVNVDLDHETQDFYEVTITVTDSGNLIDTIAVTIEILDVNEAPTFPANTATRSIPENTGSGTNIGSAFTATDVDSGHTLTYSLGGTDAGSFGFDTNSRQLQTAGALNFEGTRSYSVTITVTDGTLTDMVTVTINVTDVNEAPTFPANTATLSIPENTGSGTNIGSAFTATDVDSGHTLTYSLGGTDAGSFGL